MVVIERERMVRSVLNGPSVLFLSQPLMPRCVLKLSGCKHTNPRGDLDAVIIGQID